MVKAKWNSRYYFYIIIFSMLRLGDTKNNMHEQQKASSLVRAGELLESTMLFIMTTSSTNYDAYFYLPSLRAFNMSAITTEGHKDSYDTLINFLANDFKQDKHASKFEFSLTETRDQFLARFLKHLQKSNKVPENVKAAAITLEPYVYQEERWPTVVGFIKPCPMYLFVRMFTLLVEFDRGCLKELQVGHLESLEIIITFLTRDFQPSIHGEGLDLNDGKIEDIMLALAFGFAQEKGKCLTLSDGTLASAKNKEFFERILPKVPADVQTSINNILPYL